MDLDPRGSSGSSPPNNGDHPMQTSLINDDPTSQSTSAPFGIMQRTTSPVPTDVEDAKFVDKDLALHSDGLQARSGFSIISSPSGVVGDDGGAVVVVHEGNDFRSSERILLAPKKEVSISHVNGSDPVFMSETLESDLYTLDHRSVMTMSRMFFHFLLLSDLD